jgi:glycerophosphoryl diester phosphodiesterase
VHYQQAHNGDLQRLYGPLTKLLAGRVTFEALATVPALRQMRADYAAGIGTNKTNIARVAANAAGTGLAVHAYTVRAEPEFLRQTGGMASACGGRCKSAHAEILHLRELGATGVFVDQPDIGVKARAVMYRRATNKLR